MEAIDWLHRGLQCLTSGKYSEAIECFKKSLSMYQDGGDLERIADCHYNMGECYQMMNKYSEAVINYEQSLSIFQEIGDQEMIAHCYYDLGECYRMLQKYSDTALSYQQSLSMFQEKGDQIMIARCYYGLGECYRMLHDKDSEAVTNYEQSLSMYKEMGDQEKIAQCYYGLGRCYQMWDKYSEAVINYELSLSIFQDIGDLEKIARCYYGLSECYLMLNNYSKAIINYEQSLSIIVNHNLENRLKLHVTAGLGFSFFHLNRLQEAKEYIDKAVIIAKQIGEWKLEWRCSYILSILHCNQRKFQTALDYAERAIEIAERKNSAERKQITYRVLGQALASLGRVKEAIDYLERYLKYTKQVGNRNEEGQVCCSLSGCFMKIHDYDKAISYAEESVEIAKETDDLNTEGVAYGSLGSALRQTGKVKEAMKYYMKHLEIATQTGNKPLEANAYNNLGIASKTLGNHYEAIKYFEKSKKLNYEMGCENANGATYNNFGVLYKSIGKYVEAAEYLEQCRDVVKDTGEISGEIRVYQNLSQVYSQSNNFDLIGEFECRWKSIILAIRTGDKCGEVDYFQDLGKCFCKTDNIIEAIKSHKKALYLALKIKISELLGGCYTSLGYTYFQSGMMYEAIHVYENGLKIYTDSGNKEKEARCRRNIGVAYINLAHKHEISKDHNIKISEQYLRESLQCYEELFDNLREKHELKISIVDTYVEAYNNLALLLTETNRTTEALIVCERGRACALGDTLVCKYDMQQQQLFVEKMSTRKLLKESDLTDILPKESSLLFYSIIKESAHLWVLSQQQPLIYAENVMEQNSITNKNLTEYIYQLAGSAYQFTKFCENTSLGKQEPCNSEKDDDQHNDTKEPLKELFKQLITPVQEHLTQDEIIIIPDGPLNLVPFAALQDPQTGRFLCETKRIRLAPSLTTLKVLKDCPDDYHSKKGALVIGNPLVGEVMFRGRKVLFQNLPNAMMEAGVFGSILGVSPLIGIHATKDAVKEKLQEDAAVIHIAAHGDDTTGEIALAPGISAQSKAIPEEEDYILTMQEVQEIGVRAKLVVLSSCHTGRGEIRAEGVIGMARAFLAAGARAVVASLWAIDDKATLDFMVGFYTHLRSGWSASVSLNESMKELIRERKYSHPMYWAPFVLIGDDVTIF